MQNEEEKENTETRVVIREESSQEQPSELEQKSVGGQALDMDEFNALDEKIKSGEYNDDEENRFEGLSHLYA